MANNTTNTSKKSVSPLEAVASYKDAVVTALTQARDQFAQKQSFNTNPIEDIKLTTNISLANDIINFLNQTFQETVVSLGSSEEKSSDN